MKVMIISCVLWFIVTTGKAQALELQQLQVNMEKLAQMKLMLSQMKQGYQVLQDGYNQVRDGVKGNFILHKQYLDGLLRVSLALKQTGEIRNVEDNQRMLISELKASSLLFARSGLFTDTEIAAYNTACRSFSERVVTGKQMLEIVLSDGSLRMSDADRMELIQQLELSSSQMLQEGRSYVKSWQQMLAVRRQHKKDAATLRRLAGIK